MVFSISFTSNIVTDYRNVLGYIKLSCVYGGEKIDYVKVMNATAHEFL